MNRSLLRHPSNNTHGSYYLYKLFIFLVLIAASFLAANSLAYRLNPENSGQSLCETTVSGWISGLTGSTFTCDEVTQAGSADAPPTTDEQKTIWNPLSKSWLTEEQVSLLKLAYDVGLNDGGIEHSRLMQSTLLQETIAGQLGRVGHRTAPVGKRSYGVMQVKVTAALDVLSEHPELGEFRTDEELIVRLMTDDEFNIRVASKFLLFLRSKTASDSEALVAYNVGLRASRRYDLHDEFRYVKRVNQYFRSVVIPFNEKYLGQVIDPASPV